VKIRKDADLSYLVSEYVVARDERGFDHNMDFTENGFTDFDYVDKELAGSDMLEVGMNLAEAAAGREVWLTCDGVGFRIFFGPLEEVKEKVRSFIKALDVQEVMDA